MARRCRQRSLAFFWALCLVTVVTVALVCILYPSRLAKLSLGNTYRIHKGMTEAEVEQVLGGPAGDYGKRVDWKISVLGQRYPIFSWSETGDTVFYSLSSGYVPTRYDEWTYRNWLSKEGGVQVIFLDDVVQSVREGTHRPRSAMSLFGMELPQDALGVVVALVVFLNLCWLSYAARCRWRDSASQISANPFQGPP
jgi:hypothetical protein